MANYLDKAQQRRQRAALACAKRLDDAAEALIAFLHACRDCNDNSADELHGMSDSRHRLIDDLSEYSTYLQSVYGD